MKASHKEFITDILEDKESFTEYIDKVKFSYYFGVLLKIESWLQNNWKKIDLTNKRNMFVREGVNEPIFPKLKYLIRKGVPLKSMKEYVLNVFAIANIDTQIDFTFAVKQVSHALEEFIENSPTFGHKIKLDVLLNHHSLNRAGMRVNHSNSSNSRF